MREILLTAEARFGANVADAVQARLTDAFKKLAGNAGMGHLREDITDNASIRFWSVDPSLVAYTEVKDGIVILLL